MKPFLLVSLLGLVLSACSTAQLPRYEVTAAYVVPAADLVVVEAERPEVLPCAEEVCEEEEWEYQDRHTITVHGATARVSGQGKPDGPTTPLMMVMDPEDSDIRALEFPIRPRFALKTHPDSEFAFVTRTPDGTGWLYQNEELGRVALVRPAGASVFSADLGENVYVTASNTRVQIYEWREDGFYFASAPVDRPGEALTLTKVEIPAEEGEGAMLWQDAQVSETGTLVAVPTEDSRIVVYDLERSTRIKTLQSEVPIEANFFADSALILVRRPLPTDPKMSFLPLNSDEEIEFEAPFSPALARLIPGSMVRAYFQQDSVIYLGPGGERVEFPQPKGAVVGNGASFYQVFEEDDASVLVQFNILTGEELELARFSRTAELLGQITTGLVVLDLQSAQPGAVVHILDLTSDATDIIPLYLQWSGERIPVYGPPEN